MENITYIAYLVSAIFFIFGLKKLSSAKTARQGNLLSGIGMLIAIVVTLLDKQIIDFTFIIAGIIVGGTKNDGYAADGGHFQRFWRRRFHSGGYG